jgi:hypothetical protein
MHYITRYTYYKQIHVVTHSYDYIHYMITYIATNVMITYITTNVMGSVSIKCAALFKLSTGKLELFCASESRSRCGQLDDEG